MGERVQLFMQEHGDRNGRRNWKACVEQEFGLKYSREQALRLTRAHKFYLEATKDGKRTLTAVGGSDPKRCRRTNEESKAARRKAACLDWELFHYFMDEIHSLQGRADSSLMLKEAKIFGECWWTRDGPPANCLR